MSSNECIYLCSWKSYGTTQFDLPDINAMFVKGPASFQIVQKPFDPSLLLRRQKLIYHLDIMSTKNKCFFVHHHTVARPLKN